MTSFDTLLSPYTSQQLNLKNKVVLAPMTRCQADPEQMPSQNMCDFYTDRSSCGLIVTEATCISDESNAYFNTPGIYTSEQAKAWCQIVDKVHTQGAKIFAQLWHAGMMGHSSFRQGRLPLSPSGIKPLKELVPRLQVPYETPHIMDMADFDLIKGYFVQAADYAIRLGQFDGVEIHAANGYLFDSFLHYSTNKRTDRYGRNLEGMSRFLLEVIEAVAQKVGGFSKVGIRLSPVPPPNMESLLETSEDQNVYAYLLNKLSELSLAYVHLSSDDDDKTRGFLPVKSSEFLRKYYQGTLIVGGNYSLEHAEQTLTSQQADLIYFGKKILANPDFVDKLNEETASQLTPFSPAMIASPPRL
ncbi:MAG: alkene reductase [Janthinobacterium lividum]